MHKDYFFSTGAAVVSVMLLGAALGGSYLYNQMHPQKRQNQIAQNVKAYQEKARGNPDNIFENYPFLKPDGEELKAAQKHLSAYIRDLARKSPSDADTLLKHLNSSHPPERYAAFAKILVSLSSLEDRKAFVRAHNDDFFFLENQEDYPYDSVCLFADQTLFFEAHPDRAGDIKFSCAKNFLIHSWSKQKLSSHETNNLLLLHPQLASDLFSLRKGFLGERAEKFSQHLIEKIETRLLSKNKLLEAVKLMNILHTVKPDEYAELSKAIQGFPPSKPLSEKVEYVLAFFTSHYPQYGKSDEELRAYFHQGLNADMPVTNHYTANTLTKFLQNGRKLQLTQESVLIQKMWYKGFLYLDDSTDNAFAVLSRQDDTPLIKSGFKLSQNISTHEKFLSDGQHVKVIPLNTLKDTLETLLPEKNKANLARILEEASDESDTLDDEDNEVMAAKLKLFWVEFIQSLPIHELFEIMKKSIQLEEQQNISITIKDTGSLRGNIQAWEAEYDKLVTQEKRATENTENSLKGLLEFE